MRRLLPVVLCVAAAADSGAAFAGSLDDVLRGSKYDTVAQAPPRYVPGKPTYFRWEGFYAGAQYGRSFAGMDFGSGTQSLIDYILRNDVVGTHVSNWTTLSNTSTSMNSYGAFVGYNMQWEDAVVGFELNYNRVASGGSGSSADSMSRAFQDDTGAPAGHHYFYSATVASSASARLTNFGTIRVRAGYVMDRFMPYAFGGVAIGTVDTVRSATVSYTRRDIPDVTDPPTTPQATFNTGPMTRSDQKSNAVAYGYTAGLGIDIAVMPNLFVRGEWEYIQFTKVNDINISLNTVRAGVAVKF